MLENFSLRKKNALVVGGSGDLGFAIVRALSEAGANVIFVDIDPKGSQQEQELQKQGYSVKFLKVDIRKEIEIEKNVANVLEIFSNKIDILFNSAGIQRRYPSEDFPLDEFDKVININLRAAFIYCQLVGKNMIENKYGKIVNIASMQSFLGGLTIPAYAASKGGIAQLTKALSNDWASKGLCVNGIAPGYMDTQLNINLVNDPERNIEVLSRIPKMRWGKPADIKGLSIFLASEASDYITGAIIPVDGGFLAR